MSKIYVVTANDTVLSAFTEYHDAESCIESLKYLRANRNVNYRIVPRTLYTEWE